MSVRILTGDVRDKLKDIADESIHCVVTSPPYWGLRDYGIEGQLGLEATPEEHVERMVGVFREVRRVLREDGTLWLNYGDSYANTGNNKQTDFSASKVGYGGKGRGHIGGQPAKEIPPGLKPKDLVGMPWRVAFALQADGWWLRSDIIWHKLNPMPESVTDRPTKSHEHVFLLAKSQRYYYDADAVREPVEHPELLGQKRNVGVIGDADGLRRPDGLQGGAYSNPAGRNLRDVWTIPEEEWAQFLRWKEEHGGGLPDSWTIPTHAYSEAHFATFPPKLVEPCIKAGCPEDGTVLDPFGGAGTVGLVADRLGRDAILIELNPKYAAMAKRRIYDDCPMFADVL